MVTHLPYGDAILAASPLSAPPPPSSSRSQSSSRSSAAGGAPAQASVVIPLHVTVAGKAVGYTAATGRATARQGASGSWNITLTVAHLKHFEDAKSSRGLV